MMKKRLKAGKVHINNFAMWQIDQQFKDTTNPLGTNNLLLNADKPIMPTKFTPPIIWKGYLDGNEIEIVQKGNFTHSLSDFDFLRFPEKYSYIKKDIVTWINDFLKILD